MDFLYFLTCGKQEWFRGDSMRNLNKKNLSDGPGDRVAGYVC